VNFLELLESEIERRHKNNSRYSLRAFARHLGTDHSTLSQILRRRRNLTSRKVRLFGARLRLGNEIIVDSCVAQDSEAVARLLSSRPFRCNSRWIATRVGIPLDGVNAALHRLLHNGRLTMNSPNRWKINR
jgi:hypothetical protein